MMERKLVMLCKLTCDSVLNSCYYDCGHKCTVYDIVCTQVY